MKKEKKIEEIVACLNRYKDDVNTSSKEQLDQIISIIKEKYMINPTDQDQMRFVTHKKYGKGILYKITNSNLVGVLFGYMNKEVNRKELEWGTDFNERICT